jgi:[ribosomal protein S18]-alanine N-acetyltransferase
MQSQSQPLSIVIRQMTKEDVQSVHEIDVLSFSLPWSERSYTFEVMENQHSSVWVAEAVNASGDKAIAGMIVIWIVLDEAHVATIAVHPDFRQHGVGRRLLAKGLLAAFERGARLAYLEVRRGNLSAQHLYHKFGFKVVGERPRYYKDNNEDALLMTLEDMRDDALQAFLR